MMALDFSQNFFGSGRALLPIYARDILGVGPQGLGLLYSATSAGALVMGAVMSMRGPVQRPGVWVLVSVGYVWRLHGALRHLALFLVILPDARGSGRGQHGELCPAQHNQSAGNTRRNTRTGDEREQHVYQHRTTARTIRSGRRGGGDRPCRCDGFGRTARYIDRRWTCGGCLCSEIRGSRESGQRYKQSAGTCLALENSLVLAPSFER